MSKKERPKIYQHTSGGGHELIHNNPSPLEALGDLQDLLFYKYGIPKVEKKLNTIKQALTNYANMVEMLEGLVDDYQKLVNVNTFGYSEERIRYCETLKDVIADITKVLEGKINE
jgi:uncharacterized membrane-anchored protein YhcB (DUF1043 family)